MFSFLILWIFLCKKIILKKILCRFWALSGKLPNFYSDDIIIEL